ncbi:hypothetical protein GJ496_008027 [Pomphorhynchus laevis]|nr:hypothetical protein GJ496_008027 [Pomphorhynchus laevis]
MFNIRWFFGFQNCVRFVDNLEITDDSHENLQSLVDDRFWGPSILFVDKHDFMPYSITAAVMGNRGFTLMPLYGLNVYSILKHDTLVLTLRALDLLEDKLITSLNSTHLRCRKYDPLFSID